MKLFFLAGEDRVWHPASMKIDGDKVIVTSSGGQEAARRLLRHRGSRFQPNLYNKALLPMTPFIYFDNKMVTSETWPDEKLKIAGETIDPKTVGKGLRIPQDAAAERAVPRQRGVSGRQAGHHLGFHPPVR